MQMGLILEFIRRTSKAFQGIIHRHQRGIPAFAEIGGQMGGKVQCILCEFPLFLVIAKDNMGAGNIFYVKPYAAIEEILKNN